MFDKYSASPNTTFPLCQTQKPNNNLTEYSPEIEEHELKQNLKTPGKYLSNEKDFSRKKNVFDNETIQRRS